MRAARLALATALLLAGCAQPGPRAAQAPAGVGVAAMAADADPARMDLATYERLTAEALGEAVASGDAASVRRFVAWADGPDPQPASSRAIAASVVRQDAAAKVAPALRADLARIADGGARTVKAQGADGIVFPRDEGSHANALTEWWYLNGHLESKSFGVLKTRYGYEFTLFKIGPLLHWAHVAITDPKGKRFKYTRQWIKPSEARDVAGGLDQAYGAHRFAARPDGGYTLATRFGDEAFELALTPKKAPLLIGGDGKIDMPEGKDSWYYSQTRLDVRGALTVGGERKEVTGISWIDHQWGPFFVSGFLDRWDWFALQFEDGTEYNLFAFRDRNGNAGKRHVNRSGSDGRGSVGTAFTMDRLAWWQSPVTGLHYTTKWQLGLPESKETVELEAVSIDQEVARRVQFVRDPLPHYWEGAMKATKRRADGKKVEGFGYCEHFGWKTLPAPGPYAR